MSDPASRMLRLLSLLQTHRHWAGEELAERLAVSTRTIRRDVDRLRALGYPVAGVNGNGGGYRLEAGSELPPLLLDDEEAVAIAVGLRTAAGGTVIGIEEASMRALAKLEQVLPSRLRRRVNALGTYTVPLLSATGLVHHETLATITLACRDHERLRFRYRTRDGTTARRMTEPHRLVPAGRRWYLVAWDVDRADWRTFRVDRLDEPQPTGVRFTERALPTGDAATFVAEARRAPFAQHEVAIRLHAPVAALAEQVPASVGTLEAIDEQYCMLRSRIDSLDWFAVYVGMLGCDFEVVTPPELTDLVRTVAARLARAAGYTQ